jgi:hypothetical protein
MGGGLFNTPLYLNLKCILFGILLIFVYNMPHPKFIQHYYISCFLLACAGYVMLAWYDYLYDCTDRMGPTFFANLLGWMKPYQGVPPGTKPLPLKYKKIVGVFDFVVILVIIGAFVYPYMHQK